MNNIVLMVSVSVVALKSENLVFGKVTKVVVLPVLLQSKIEVGPRI